VSTLFSNTLSICSTLKARYQVSHPYESSGKIRVLCILILTFLESRGEDKGSELNGSKHFPNVICSQYIGEENNNQWIYKRRIIRTFVSACINIDRPLPRDIHGLRRRQLLGLQRKSVWWYGFVIWKCRVCSIKVVGAAIR
jgi:hypothetical protein